MTVLPSLVVYWRMDGGDDKFTVPPLEDILKYPPYPAYVNLLAGRLERFPETGNVGIYVPPEIVKPLKDGVGKKLQDEGIKVVLSIFSYDGGKGEDKEKRAVGWSTLTTDDNAYLVNQIRELQDRKGSYQIDGIDIDDEYGPVGEPKNFYFAVRATRELFPDLVISQPVWAPDITKYKEYPDLARLMTYCATMSYGNKSQYIIKEVQDFNDLGIPMQKLYAGVYPGPIFPDAKSCRRKPPITDCDGKICKEAETNPPQAWTSIEVSKEVAEWTKTKGADGKPNCAGVMIFSYSTDTVEYASCPIKSGWPNKDDHAWQTAITSVLTAK